MKIIRHVQLCLSSTYISYLLHLTDKFDNTKGCDLTVSTYAIVKASLHRFAHNISVLASRGKNRNDGGKVHTLHSPLWAFYCDSTEKHQTEKIHALTTYLQNCTVRFFWFFVKPSVVVFHQFSFSNNICKNSHDRKVSSDVGPWIQPIKKGFTSATPDFVMRLHGYLVYNVGVHGDTRHIHSTSFSSPLRPSFFFFFFFFPRDVRGSHAGFI